MTVSQYYMHIYIILTVTAIAWLYASGRNPEYDNQVVFQVQFVCFLDDLSA